MKTLPRDQANVLWQEWWDEMRDEWFKVEVLQNYYGEDTGPSLDSWLEGDKERSIELIKETDYSEWIQKCRNKLKKQVKLIRVHVLEEPFTPYIEWELQHYKLVNVPKCGEVVYLINRSETNGLETPNGDVMIFDQKRVVVNTYNNRGRVTHQTFYDEADEIGRFLELKKTLMERAKPL